ncbi:MAG: hypothetical protein AAGE59_19995 [Cyanobacteria bacterium P01_F01_bin.86]
MSTNLKHTADLTNNDYVVVGVASCYQLEEGELKSIQVLEPVPSASLETIFQGTPTSYQCLQSMTVGEVLAKENATTISGVEGARFCQNFVDRVAAAARTYKARPSAQAFIPLGEVRTDINHSTEKKRVLNQDNKVTVEDNVRQHSHTHKVL